MKLQEVEQKRFLEPLSCRLSVLRIRVPRFGERLQDLLILVEGLIHRLAFEYVTFSYFKRCLFGGHAEWAGYLHFDGFQSKLSVEPNLPSLQIVRIDVPTLHQVSLP